MMATKIKSLMEVTIQIKKILINIRLHKTKPLPVHRTKPPPIWVKSKWTCLLNKGLQLLKFKERELLMEQHQDLGLKINTRQITKIKILPYLQIKASHRVIIRIQLFNNLWSLDRDIILGLNLNNFKIRHKQVLILKINR